MKTLLYWIIHIVWGLPTFIIGSLMALIILMLGKRPRKFGYSIYFTLKSMNNSGFSIGPFFFIGDNCINNLSIKQHEHGHGIQTLYFGPIMLFIVIIPSIIRFYYRDIRRKSIDEKYKMGYLTKEEYLIVLSNLPKYDDIWFEGQATKLGKKYFPEEQ